MTQEDMILNYMREGNTITSLEALNLFQCFRLASRVSNLKKQGYNIKSSMIKNINQKYYAQYSLEPKKDLFV